MPAHCREAQQNQIITSSKAWKYDNEKNDNFLLKTFTNKHSLFSPL